MTKNKLKFIFILLFITVIPFTLGNFIFKNVYNITKQSQSAQVGLAPTYENKENPPQEDTTTIFFVGDIMLTRGVKSSVMKNFNGDYSKMFENLPELKNADILFGNLEGPVSDKGNNVGSKYSFRMDPEILQILRDAGFDIVSFANNHIGDWNVNAFNDTLTRLEEIGILKTGAGRNKNEVINPTIIEKNNIKFGFLGVSDVGPNWMQAKDDTAGILLANDPKLEEIIQNAKTQCDVLIVSFHFGDEYKTQHNSRQEKLAHNAINSGADMVIGHHPHVMEDIEEYNGKTIVYSLGNFIFDQYFSKETMQGMLFSATFKNKNLVETNKRIITLNKQFQPEGIFEENEFKQEKLNETPSSSNCPKPSKEYDDMSLLNIGQEIKLPDEEYIPKGLEELSINSSTRKGICLTKEAKENFELMAKSSKKDGYTIKASSGFRNFETQESLISKASKKDTQKATISVAKAGYSEHQLGTAVDITGESVNYYSATNSFDNSLEDLWLRDNAYLYGFIQSYPKDKAFVTGYKYEPWHYRYVGIENAKYIKENKLTITEFLQ